jgi:hypothetical protein
MGEDAGVACSCTARGSGTRPVHRASEASPDLRVANSFPARSLADAFAVRSLADAFPVRSLAYSFPAVIMVNNLPCRGSATTQGVGGQVAAAARGRQQACCISERCPQASRMRRHDSMAYGGLKMCVCTRSKYKRSIVTHRVSCLQLRLVPC